MFLVARVMQHNKEIDACRFEHKKDNELAHLLKFGLIAFRVCTDIVSLL